MRKKISSEENAVIITLDYLVDVSETNDGYFACPRCDHRDIEEDTKKCPNCGVKFFWQLIL